MKHLAARRTTKGWATIAPALRSRNFRLFWVGQVVSTLGTFLQLVAEGWLVYDLTGSEFLLGVVGFIGLVPVVPISFLGGVLIDRVPRRRLITATQIGLLVQATVFGLLTLTGQIRVWHIIFLDFVLGMLFAIDQPARQAFLVELVGKDDLANAVALNAIVFQLSRVAGYAASGLLIATIGVGSTMLLNAATYLAPIVALALIRVPDIRQDTVRASLGVALTEGVITLWKSPPLLGTISLMAVVGGLTWTIHGMMPAFAEGVLRTDPVGLGLLLGATGLGALIGTIIVARLGPGKRGRALMLVSLLAPLPGIGIAVSRTMPVACLFLVALGLALLIMQAMANTLVQLNVSDRVRGRVMSIYSLLNAGAPKLATLLVGGLAEVIGLPLALGLSGVASILYALGLHVAMPSVRRLD